MKQLLWFWTLLLILIDGRNIFAQIGPLSFLQEISICGNDSFVYLPGLGFESSRIISFQPGDADYCSIIIKAPPTHVIHLQILEDNDRLHHILYTSLQSPCGLHIFLGNLNQQIWSGDVCSSLPLQYQVDLLSPHIVLRWKSSYDLLQTRGRKIIVTAVGKDDFCLTEGQHTCMRIGLFPIFCVADDLTCDGHQHCPLGSKTGDEDKVCEGDLSKLWKRKFIGYMNKLPQEAANNIRKDLENTSDLPITFDDLKKTWTNIRKLAAATTTETPPSDVQIGSLEKFLFVYGPWGYLCLGVVICGTVLITCCLWECCARYKMDANASRGRQPAQTIDVVNGPEDEQRQIPPNYEDLDSPPSYNTLFPNKLASGSVSSVRESIEMQSR